MGRGTTSHAFFIQGRARARRPRDGVAAEDGLNANVQRLLPGEGMARERQHSVENDQPLHVHRHRGHMGTGNGLSGLSSAVFDPGVQSQTEIAAALSAKCGNARWGRMQCCRMGKQIWTDAARSLHPGCISPHRTCDGSFRDRWGRGHHHISLNGNCAAIGW